MVEIRAVDPHDEVALCLMGLRASGAWTSERVRRNEERIRNLGRDDVHAVALTQTAGSARRPTCAWSGSTRGSPTWASPTCSTSTAGTGSGCPSSWPPSGRCARRTPSALLVPDNAGVNAPMNALNKRLGYRVVEELLEVPKRLD